MKTPPYSLISSFLAFTDAKNMMDAAKNLGMSQPALTQHLQQFEGYFPQDVFALDGRKKVLTPFGLKLQVLLKGRFQNLDRDIIELSQEHQKPEELTLRIAGRGEILDRVAKKWEFSGRLIYTPTDGADAVNGLLERRFDIAISNHLSKASQLQGRLLFVDSFSIATPKSWKLPTTKGSALFKELSTRGYLSYKESDINLEKNLEKYGIEVPPPIKTVIPNWTTLATLIEAGHGWSICPDSHINPKTMHKINLKDASEDADAKFYTLYRKELLKLRAAKEFLDKMARDAKL
ncbi:LysR family transcriptional regulator [Bdellovibrio sp. HCB337]|uniref:LysR family transcriptional regulator n=1 Tax=Bdellovibrio sp. HCB337 TaxID=3394358 RepID=UPI0039A594F0